MRRYLSKGWATCGGGTSHDLHAARGMADKAMAGKGIKMDQAGKDLKKMDMDMDMMDKDMDMDKGDM